VTYANATAKFKPGKDAFVLGLLLANETYAHHYTAEVSEVENVVRLGRSWQ